MSNPPTPRQDCIDTLYLRWRKPNLWFDRDVQQLFEHSETQSGRKTFQHSSAPPGFDILSRIIISSLRSKEESKPFTVKEPSDLLILMTHFVIKEAFVVGVMIKTLLEELGHSLIPLFLYRYGESSQRWSGHVWRSWGDQPINESQQSVKDRPIDHFMSPFWGLIPGGGKSEGRGCGGEAPAILS